MRKWTPEFGEQAALNVVAALSAFHQRLPYLDVFEQASDDERGEMWLTMLGLIMGDVHNTARTLGIPVEMVLESLAATAVAGAAARREMGLGA